MWFVANGEAVKIQSDRGVDQGDPLANPVFAISTVDPSEELR